MCNCDEVNAVLIRSYSPKDYIHVALCFIHGDIRITETRAIFGYYRFCDGYLLIYSIGYIYIVVVVGFCESNDDYLVILLFRKKELQNVHLLIYVYFKFGIAFFFGFSSILTI